MAIKKVLVAEDDPGVRKAFQYLLEKDRYVLVCVCNGREAWELLDQGKEKFDIVISDYNMPEMNGIGLLLNVRNDPRADLARTPFILMSGGSMQASSEELAEMCEKYDAAFLTKPFSVTGPSGLIALLECAVCG